MLHAAIPFINSLVPVIMGTGILLVSFALFVFPVRRFQQIVFWIASGICILGLGCLEFGAVETNAFRLGSMTALWAVVALIMYRKLDATNPSNPQTQSNIKSPSVSRILDSAPEQAIENPDPTIPNRSQLE